MSVVQCGCCGVDFNIHHLQCVWCDYFILRVVLVDLGAVVRFERFGKHHSLVKIYYKTS